MAQTDAAVTIDDQKCINRFATLNANFKELKNELNSKKSYHRALEDALESLEEILLIDEDSKVPYQLGEVFFELSPAQVQKRIEDDKKETLKRISTLDNKVQEDSAVIAELKAKLYAKFGNKINLEEDNDD